jgi:hypothetical protein
MSSLIHKPIRRNVNVGSDMSPMNLPSHEEIVKDNTFDPACTALELIAAMIHTHAGLDTQSTSTLGLITDIATLFITSQSNKTFDTSVEAIHGMIDMLVGCTYKEFLETVEVGHVYDYTKEHVARLRAEMAKKSSEAKAEIGKINLVYYNLYPNFARLEQFRKASPNLLPALKGRINVVKCIIKKDLFAKTGETTGLHGEGRFVRYCYIQYVKNLRLLELHHETKSGAATNPSPKKLFQSILQDAANYAGEAMAKELRAMQIYVASSQVACKDCQDMLKTLRISHNTQRYSKESPSPNWANPFTMQPKGSTQDASPYLLAANVAERLAEQYHIEQMKAKQWNTGSEPGEDMET